MSDNASPKYQLLVALMDIQQDASGYRQKNQQNQSTMYRDIVDLLFQRPLGMLEHTQLKQHDHTVASLDV